jgi:hypothetical protein
MKKLFSGKVTVWQLAVMGAAGCGSWVLAHPNNNERLMIGEHSHPATLMHEKIVPDPSRAHPYKKTIPPGQLAEIWYLATQKWTDVSRTQVRYCVYPRIEVTGNNPWILPFNMRLLRGPGPAGIELAALAVTGPFDAGTSRELISSSQWCVLGARASPPQLFLDTDFGGVPVQFGPALPPR